MRTHQTRDRFHPSHRKEPFEDPDVRLVRGAMYLANMAGLLGFENGLAGADPDGACLTADAPGEDDGFAPDGPPCGIVIEAYRVAWGRGRDRSHSQKV